MLKLVEKIMIQYAEGLIPEAVAEEMIVLAVVRYLNQVKEVE